LSVQRRRAEEGGCWLLQQVPRQCTFMSTFSARDPEERSPNYGWERAETGYEIRLAKDGKPYLCSKGPNSASNEYLVC
jgi:hypothetical protein